MKIPYLKYFGLFAIVAIALTGFGYNRLPHWGLATVSAHENGNKIIIEPNLEIILSLPNLANENSLDQWMETIKNLDDNVWLVAHEHTSDGSEGQILGYVGLHDDGQSTVFQLEKTSWMDNSAVLMLHYDRGQTKVFEPTGADTPVRLNNEPLMLEVEINAYPEFFIDDSRLPFLNQQSVPMTNDRQMLPHDELSIDDRTSVY
ncbi:MAG TPA: hypothetical protein VJH75_03980 [Patescibacteria group bacterium]|nr:hypothetical protein [Patescibacteria group bacterium]